MNPRALAIRVLARVEATDAYLNAVLDEALASAPPHDARDAALCTELTYGATRRRLLLDASVQASAHRKLTTLEDRVLAALRVGAYQIFFTRIPARAAVSETVEALKEMGLARAAGFVNAVLRKVAELPAPPLPPEEPLALHLSVRESHPEWLVARWLARYGAERVGALLEADNRAPPLVARVNAPRSDRAALLQELKEAGLEVEPTDVSPAGVRFASPGRVEQLYGYAEGLWQVQDEAAQLVVQYAAVPPGSRVWDVCAAPGGKACQLAEANDVLATDLHAHKLRRLLSEARRLGVAPRLRALAHDALQPLPEGEGAFDAVLLDAPCSGVGTLRRHPELRYRRVPEDIARLAALQRSLLDAAGTHVRAGGLLVYAVCSPEPEEGEEQIRAFLSEHSDFHLEAPEGWSGAAATPEGFLLTLPDVRPWDGFFAARLRRS